MISRKDRSSLEPPHKCKSKAWSVRLGTEKKVRRRTDHSSSERGVTSVADLCLANQVRICHKGKL